MEDIIRFLDEREEERQGIKASESAYQEYCREWEEYTRDWD